MNIRIQTDEELDHVLSITLELIGKIKSNLANKKIDNDEKNYLLSNYSVLQNFLNKIQERKALL